MEERLPEECWILEGGLAMACEGVQVGECRRGWSRACFCVKFGYALKTCVVLHPVAMDATPASSGHAAAIFHVVNIAVTTSTFFACL